jgi:hypothetical protein
MVQQSLSGRLTALCFDSLTVLERLLQLAWLL